MKFSTTAMARWFFVAGVAAALMATGCSGKKQDEPNGNGKLLKTVVTLELCGDCCSVPSGDTPTISLTPGTVAADSSIPVTTSSTNADHVVCDTTKAKLLTAGHYLAVIVDDDPPVSKSHIRYNPSGPQHSFSLKWKNATPKVIRGYLAFNTSGKHPVAMKNAEASKAHCYANSQWSPCTDSMVVLNLPEHQKTYQSADIPLDFVLNNAPLGANLKLHVVIPSTLDTDIDQNKPYRIKNLPPGNHTVTVQLQKPKTGGGWEDVPGEFAHSSREFTVQ